MNQPPKKRRRFSFSLRTLMVFMLALCLLFGFIGMRLQRAREQEAFLRELGESGWSLSFADTDDREPNLWDLLIDSNYIDRIDFVESVSATGLDLTPLSELKNLEWLHLDNTQVTDLTQLSELRNLDWLRLHNTPVSDLTPLVKLKNLVNLDLSNTQVTDLTPLAELKHLEILNVSNTQVSDQQVQQFQKALPNCKIYH